MPVFPYERETLTMHEEDLKALERHVCLTAPVGLEIRLTYPSIELAVKDSNSFRYKTTFCDHFRIYYETIKVCNKPQNVYHNDHLIWTKLPNNPKAAEGVRKIRSRSTIIFVCPRGSDGTFKSYR